MEQSRHAIGQDHPGCTRVSHSLLREKTVANGSYGYISKSDSTSLRQRRSSFPLPPHKREKSSRQNSVTVYNGNGDDSSGQVMFYELLNQGALVEDGTGNYNGAGGFTREWDACSKTVSCLNA